MRPLRVISSLLLSTVAAACFAHHSFAMFDQTQTVTLKGTVTAFQWTNPHAFIHVEIVNASNALETWEIELNSPNNLKRQGWKSGAVKVGDKVTLLTNPLRDLTQHKGGLFISVTLPDGTVLGEATRAGGGPINVPVLPPK
jgi:ABC-type glycerol-3-phosphate transport system substrate-binding protein